MQYDANGNPAHPVQWDSGPETFPYDGENRLLGSPYNGWGYTYDPSGKRVYKSQHVGPNGESSCEIYFYGLSGKKLATYACGWKQTQFGWQYIADGFEWKSYDHYFGGKQIRAEGVTVVADRLGSVRMRSSGQRMSYYPYGEERTATANDGSLKFGTYLRDADGMDYADQRYYASGMGRFMTPDPSLRGAGVEDPTTGGSPADPGSWNQYAYVVGDPVNRYDPFGLDWWDPNTNTLHGDLDPASTKSGTPGTIGSREANGGGDAGMFVPAISDGEGQGGSVAVNPTEPVDPTNVPCPGNVKHKADGSCATVQPKEDGTCPAGYDPYNSTITYRGGHPALSFNACILSPKFESNPVCKVVMSAPGGIAVSGLGWIWKRITPLSIVTGLACIVENPGLLK